VAVATAIHMRRSERSARIAGQLPGHERRVGDARVVRLRDESHPVRVKPIAGGQEVTSDAGRFTVLSDWKPGNPVFAGTVNGEPVSVRLERSGIKYRLTYAGTQADMLVLTEHAAKMQALMPDKPPPDLSRLLLSPMPGLLSELAVRVGQPIKAGEKLAVIEAMKMENVLRAERDAVVKSLLAKAGDSLAVDQPIVEFE
jgi:propionyl-CoA carboxylase alpha chain